ncbi:MAG: hypothetical protein WCL71_04750 [Deltaproteobacteria bacterium]
MQRIIVIIGMLAMMSAPSASTAAGWGDFLNSAERLDSIIVNRPGPSEQAEPSDEPPPRHNESRPAPSRGNDDSHFIQSDDYFINNEGLGNHSYIYVKLSKMVTPPSSGSKGEGEFMKVSDGQNQWTSYIWQSRIASTNELKLGMHVIAFNDNNQNGVYQAPNKKDRARGGQWFLAKITDMSDSFKGFVTVSGNYKVGLRNIRIPIPY